MVTQTLVSSLIWLYFCLPLIKFYQVETKDALLHAINEEYVEAVEVLLDHEESIHVEGEPWSWETLSEQEVRISVSHYTGLSMFCS